MEMPKPTEAHKQLEKLTGTWVGEEVMHPSPWDPEGSTARGRSRARMGLGGFAVIVDYDQQKDGRTTFTGHGVYTYDAKQQCYVLWWFDCMGQQPNQFKGNFDGDVLSLVSDESAEGGPRVSRLVYDLGEPGRIDSRMEVSEDGTSWKVFMEARYERQD